MELWTVTINVKLTVCDSYESLEVRYDDYNEQFRAVVEMARSLLQESSSKVLPATIIQSSLVPALLWCGMKCRDSLIRADIVRLIDEIKGQNTTISAFLMALKKVIQYESGDVKLGEQIPETARLASVKLNIIPGQEKVDLWYRTSALDPHLIDDDLWLYNSISV
ncbi:uncharacterized protein N7511_004752 [Penicillium nucicola]|uniref:uncharacterized protein n=1 Tax=Penicillium nucicola TaxID=1850975 RepID=UPI002545BD26|nr:uncharacterized protein N7511_004752 [Penicillium nucicola]KAJ5767136.1 hypothetical protein N7511_004752 [Penicillium nucicola]